MKIGIIIHSQTGNTLKVAHQIKDKLIASGHSVNVEQIAAIEDGQMDVQKIQLKATPDISTYDALIIGAPVRGFSFSPVMTAFLSKAANLQNKNIACFVTQAFPFPSMGGNRAIKQAKEFCESLGGKVCDTGIINRSNFRSKQMTETLVEKFSSIFE